MCDVDIEQYEVHGGSVKRARKAHTCDACTLLIETGRDYYKHAGFFDGNWDHATICLRCHKMGNAIQAATREPISILLDCGEDWLEGVTGRHSNRHIAQSQGIAELLGLIDDLIPVEVQALAFALPGDFA